jgi:hypothetical protein
MEQQSHDQLQRLNELERVVSASANYVAAYGDDIIFMNTAGVAKLVTIPAPRGGLRITIVQKGGSTTTVSADGGALINGAASVAIATNYTPLRLKAVDGAYISI